MTISEIHLKQLDFFNSNITKDPNFRIKNLKKLLNLLKDNEEKLSTAIYEDFGKSPFEAYLTEYALLYSEINVAIKNLKKWTKPKKVFSDLANLPSKTYVIAEPLGTTLVIGAWNYPYQISLAPVIASMAAGNTIILKPSELANECSKILAELINKAFSNEYFYVIEGGISETTELLEQKFDKIFFTGSTPVGKIVYQAAAKNLIPVTLELGGKSPTFVFKDCDLKVTARRIVWAKYLNAGQTCVAPDYILVEKSIEKELLEALQKEIEHNYLQNDDISNNYVRIINNKNFDRLTKLIDKDKLYYGGKTNKANRYIEPSVFCNISFDDEIMKDEIFGPLLPVIAFDDLDTTIKKVKSLNKPLSCYIYTKNKAIIDKLLNEISFGGGCINDSIMHLSNPKIPFGGVGMSGIGNYHGKFGFDSFSHYKSILHKGFSFETKIKYQPYSDKKLNIIKKLLS